MTRNQLIEYTNDFALDGKRGRLRIEGYRISRTFDLLKEQGAYNSRIEVLNAEGADYDTLIVGGTSVELYLRNPRAKHKEPEGDVDWNIPLGAFGERARRVLK